MKNRKETNRIIIHHSLSDFGDAKQINEWHIQRGFDGIGYHFVIPRTGEHQTGRGIEFVGAHAMGKNYDSIGVCFVGDFSKYNPNESQYNEFISLYQFLCKKFNKKLKIEFHHELCPGKFFDRNKFNNI